METIKVRTHVGSDGLLKLELPVGVGDADYDVVVIMQVLPEAVDEMGWPIGFFDRTYGALTDNPLERPAQPPLDVRDEID